MVENNQPTIISALVSNSEKTEKDLENALSESNNIRQEAGKIEELLEEIREDNEKLLRLVRGIAGESDETYQAGSRSEELPTNETREEVANLLRGVKTERELESKVERIEDNMKSYISNLFEATEEIKTNLNHYTKQAEALEQRIED